MIYILYNHLTGAYPKELFSLLYTDIDKARPCLVEMAEKERSGDIKIVGVVEGQSLDYKSILKEPK